jgi:hypothetical protein
MDANIKMTQMWELFDKDLSSAIMQKFHKQLWICVK